MADNLWAPFALPATGAARVREIVAAQEEYGRKHPGLWMPAPPYALRFRPKRSTVPTLEIRLVAGYKPNPSPDSDPKDLAKDANFCITAWKWRLDADMAKPNLARLYDAALDPPEGRLLRDDAYNLAAMTRRNALLIAALEHFAIEEHPFAGLSHCGICGKGLIDPDSIARGIGPECIRMFGAGRGELVTAKLVSLRTTETTIDMFDDGGA